MHNDFLVEIGCEELPAKHIDRLAQALLQGITEGLQKAQLSFDKANYLASPRRLAVTVHGLQLQQAQQAFERKGPPLKAAYDANGNPSRALQGFLQSCGAQLNQLTELTTDKGVWLQYKGIKPGQAASHLLPAIVSDTIKRLPMPKTMRWGKHDIEFLRPVQWLVMMLGEQVIAHQMLGKSSRQQTVGHHFMAPQMLNLVHANQYENLLAEQGKVIVDPAKRRQLIIEQSQTLATSINGKAVIDEELLAEVTNLVEWPVALLASFDPDFLQVPAEALIAAMQVHQKSFAVMDDKQQLLPYFITISNIDSKHKKQVIQGNQKVMAARLADAKFFYDIDSKKRLEVYLPALNAVSFQKQLGSLHDKALRISQLAQTIAEQLGADTTMAARAGLLAKADLVSEMVQEFPELQGIMGYYYAKDEDAGIRDAIKQHYQPKFSGDQLPESKLACAVALADKLDTLAGIFGIGQVPTGDKDPFALRRAAMGVVRILLERQLPLDLYQLINQSIMAYADRLSNQHVASKLFDFILERLRTWYRDKQVSSEIVNAVMAKCPHQLIDVDARVNALLDFMQQPEAKPLCEANKRLRNILQKNANDDLNGGVEVNLLQEPAEQQLVEQLQKTVVEIQQASDHQNYQQVLSQLANLHSPLEAFFDNVMVISENMALRENRLRLLQQLRQLFLQVADLSLL